ncbi:hypothetical protein [Limoniibacter endophyticus]
MKSDAPRAGSALWRGEGTEFLIDGGTIPTVGIWRSELVLVP